MNIYEQIVASLLDPKEVEARRLIPQVKVAQTQEEVDAVLDELGRLETPTLDGKAKRRKR